MQVSRVSATQRPFTAARPAVARSLRLTVVAVKPTKVCIRLAYMPHMTVLDGPLKV